MITELIISTYNAPRALQLCLTSVLGQAQRPDAVVVADDGSGQDTADLIAAFQAAHPDLPLRHVWHEDQGFRKTAILNKAVAASKADYLIFTDGDCLLSPGFVARHLARSDRNSFVSGSLIRLTAEATDQVTEHDVAEARVFDIPWLRARNTFDRSTTLMKAMPLPFGVQVGIEAAYPIRRTWMGSNASAYREAVLSVNGFDETMAWGGEDKEFGIRLQNNGIGARTIRFTAPVVHLDHPRGYKDEATIARQRAMVKHARRSGKTWTENGIS